MLFPHLWSIQVATGKVPDGNGDIAEIQTSFFRYNAFAQADLCLTFASMPQKCIKIIRLLKRTVKNYDQTMCMLYRSLLCFAYIVRYNFTRSTTNESTSFISYKTGKCSRSCGCILDKI